LTDEIFGLRCHIKGDARVTENGLILNGNSFVYTDELGFKIKEKTLEVWVELFSVEQEEVGVMSLGEMGDARDPFDSIVFNQRHKAEWMSCSEFFHRSQGVSGGAEKEKGILRHMVATYSKDDMISLYKDGQPYGASYTVDSLHLFSEKSRVVFGARHIWQNSDEASNKKTKLFTSTGGLVGRVLRAALYDQALTREEVALNAATGSVKLWRRCEPCQHPKDKKNMDLLRAEFPKPTVIVETAKRGITMSQLRRVYRFACQHCHRWGHGKARNMKTLDLYDLCDWLIKPATWDFNCSLVEVMADRPQVPEWFVSHWWGELIMDFLRCLSEHSFLRGLAYNVCFWVCAYANRQHSLVGEVGSNILESTSFYKAMKKAKGVLLVLDEAATALERIWCAFEEFQAVTMSGAYRKHDQKDEEECEDTTMLLDIVVSHDGDPVVLTEGHVDHDDIDHKVTLSKASREERFPMSIIQRGLTLKLANAKASKPEDKALILRWMEAKDIGMDEANHRLRAIFAIASWRKCVMEKNVAEMKLHEILANDEKRTILKFDFSYLFQFEDCDAWYFAQGIPKSLQILEVSFEWCTQLGDAGLRAIADALARTEVRVFLLNLRSCNKLSGQAIAGLVERLPHTLRHLELQLNDKIDDTCVREIAKHVKEKADLIRLDLNFEGCGAISGSVMLGLVDAAVAPPQRKLQMLGLNISRCQNIKTRHLTKIAQALPQTLSELKLHCGRCEIRAEGFLALADKLTTLRLAKLDIRATPDLHWEALEGVKAYKKAWGNASGAAEKCTSKRLTLQVARHHGDEEEAQRHSDMSRHEGVCGPGSPDSTGRASCSTKPTLSYSASSASHSGDSPGRGSSWADLDPLSVSSDASVMGKDRPSAKMWRGSERFSGGGTHVMPEELSSSSSSSLAALSMSGTRISNLQRDVDRLKQENARLSEQAALAAQSLLLDARWSDALDSSRAFPDSTW